MWKLNPVDLVGIVAILAGLLMILTTRKLIEHSVWRHISNEPLDAFLGGRLGRAYFRSTRLIGLMFGVFGIVLIIFNRR